MRKRFSFYLDESLVKRLDAVFPKLSRSESLERVLASAVPKTFPAVVLAGGPSKNLLVNRVYRPLVKIRGKTILEWQLLYAKRIGCSKAVIVGSREVNTAVYSALGNEASGVPLEFVEEAAHGGTMHTLSQAKTSVESHFLLLPCDHVFDFSLKKLFDFHSSEQPLSTLAIHSGGEYEWLKSSQVKLEGSDVVEYWAKPDKTHSHLTSTMIGFLSPKIFSFLQEKGSLDYVFESLSRQGLLKGFIVPGTFVNVHDEKDVVQAEKLVLE